MLDFARPEPDMFRPSRPKSFAVYILANTQGDSVYRMKILESVFPILLKSVKKRINKKNCEKLKLSYRRTIMLQECFDRVRSM